MFSPTPFISKASHAVIDPNTNEYLPCMKIFVYVELTIFEYVTFVATNRCFSSSVAVKSGLLGADRVGIDRYFAQDGIMNFPEVLRTICDTRFLS